VIPASAQSESTAFSDSANDEWRMTACTLQAFMGHRSIANTVVYTSVADKRIRNIWGK